MRIWRLTAAFAQRAIHTLHVATLPRPTTRNRVLHDRFLTNCGYPRAAIDNHWHRWHPHT
ncbi:MAG: hypothetical protein INR66_03565 [Gordonia polyisoprenivorans]|nr:hypothetical protein [Gordonia polyisoprenivorans]